MVYRCLHGQAPRYLADHLITASDVTSRFCVPQTDTSSSYLAVDSTLITAVGRFLIAGPTVWNSLPDELKDPACGSDSFKQFLKTYLQSFPVSTNVTSALEVLLNDIRYISQFFRMNKDFLHKSTFYLLT